MTWYEKEVRTDRPLWYHPDGTPCSREEANAYFGSISQRRVAETTLSDGKWISTVFLVLDHRYGDGPPLLYETMVFRSKGYSEAIDCRRYSTRAEAKAGHKEVVAEWAAKAGKENG